MGWGRAPVSFLSVRGDSSREMAAAWQVLQTDTHEA